MFQWGAKNGRDCTGSRGLKEEVGHRSWLVRTVANCLSQFGWSAIDSGGSIRIGIPEKIEDTLIDFAIFFFFHFAWHPTMVLLATWWELEVPLSSLHLSLLVCCFGDDHPRRRLFGERYFLTYFVFVVIFDRWRT